MLFAGSSGAVRRRGLAPRSPVLQTGAITRLALCALPHTHRTPYGYRARPVGVKIRPPHLENTAHVSAPHRHAMKDSSLACRCGLGRPRRESNSGQLIENQPAWASSNTRTNCLGSPLGIEPRSSAYKADNALSFGPVSSVSRKGGQGTERTNGLATVARLRAPRSLSRRCCGSLRHVLLFRC